MGLAGFDVLAEGGGARGVRAVWSPSRRGHLGGEGLRRSAGAGTKGSGRGPPGLGGRRGGRKQRGVCEVCVTQGVCVCARLCVHVRLGKGHFCFRQNRKVNTNMGMGGNRTVFSQT